MASPSGAGVGWETVPLPQPTTMFKYATDRIRVVFRSRRRVVAVAAALVVAGLAVGGVPAAVGDDVDSGVADVAVTGPGAATVEADQQFVWRDRQTDLVATVVDFVNQSDTRYDTYWVRLTRDGDGEYQQRTDDSIAVEKVTLRELETRNVTLSVPSDELSTGIHELHVSMYETSTGANPRVNETTVTVRTIRESGDLDGDGLRNVDEVAADTRLLTPDTDRDDLVDGVEVHVFGSNPTTVDTDDDGVRDAHEVQNASAPALVDTDEDSLVDLAEILNRTSPSAADTDLDGLPDPVERELGTDPQERDSDGDGLADAVEVGIYETSPVETDSDADGLADGEEIQRFGTDPTEADTDGDGIPDGREVLAGTDPVEAPSSGNDTGSDSQSLFGALTPLEELGTVLARAVTGPVGDGL